MDAQPEFLLEVLRQLGGVQRRVGLERMFESIDDLLRELVRPLRPRSLRDQARQPLRLEDGLGLIKRRPREAEVGGCLSDRLAILADPPQQLVLDLDQVAGVEEDIPGGEGRVAHRLRWGVERVLAAPGGGLLGAGRWSPRGPSVLRSVQYAEVCAIV